LYCHVSGEKTETIEEIKEVVDIIGEMVNYKKTPLFLTVL